MKVLHATPTFLRDFDRASGPLAHLAEQETHHLVRLMQEHPKTWLRQYDRVAGLEETVLELELGGSSRMLVHVNGAVTLCRMGDHEIVRRTVAGRALVKSLQQAAPAPARFLPEFRSGLLPRDAGDAIGAYGEHEISPEWLYSLDEQQVEIATTILEQVEIGLLSDSPSRHLILGGPGTGKTTILIWLLKRLCDASPQSTESWDVRLQASPRLAEYLHASTHWDLTRVLRSHRGDAPDVVLVDDPGSLRQLQNVSPRSSVVAAVDPLQLTSAITDEELAEFVVGWGDEHFINVCYRQKEKVGLAAKHVMEAVAGSSPYLDDSKKERFASERSFLSNLANDMTYPNPTGRVRTETADADAYQEHVDWLYELQAQGQLWNHWSPLLIVVEDDLRLPTGWTKRLAGLRPDRVKLSRLLDVKGLEYQHVIVLLSERTHRSLSRGFTGSGNSEYNRFRLMRIPFTRAKDSIAIFAL